MCPFEYIQLAGSILLRGNRLVLNVAEKPSAALRIATILSNDSFQRQRDANPLFRFKGSYGGSDCSMTMTSVLGHLMDVDFPEDLSGWRDTDPSTLFFAPVLRFVSGDRNKEIKQMLENHSRAVDTLILWLDCDREGENIGFEVLAVCRGANPRLQVFRAFFSSLTRQDILTAMETLGEPKKLDSEAVEVRREMDLRTGAAFTRFQTLLLQDNFPDLTSVISYGPCQFPTLGFVVNRYKEIQAFVSGTFWTLTLTVPEGKTTLKWKRGRNFDKLIAYILYEMATQAKVCVVTKIQTQPDHKAKPLPLKSVELQRKLAKILRVSSHRIMQTAESLYQRGYISYPRTETDFYPESLDLRELIRVQSGDNRWAEYASQLNNGRFEVPRKGSNTDHSHPPIHPKKVGTDIRDQLEARVYEFIARHFLATCSRTARGQRTSLEMVVGGEQFVTSGLVVTERGWLEIYPYTRWDTKQLHQFVQGQKIVGHTISIVQGETKPPRYLTEPDLIMKMDKNGIGTDATIPDHIKNVQERQYVEKRGVAFHPTTLGLALYEGYSNMGIGFCEPNLRASMERALVDISAGAQNGDRVLESFKKQYFDIFVHIRSSANVLIQTFSKYFKVRDSVSVTGVPVGKCPTCDGSLLLRRTKKGVIFGGCGSRGCQTSVWFPSYVSGMNVMDERCPTCSSQMIFLNLGRSAPISADRVVCMNCSREFLSHCSVKTSGPNPPRKRKKQPKKKRRRLCSICRQPGHTRKTCPRARSSARV